MYLPVDESWAFTQIRTGNWSLHGHSAALYKGTRRLDVLKSKAYRFSTVPGLRTSLTKNRDGSHYDWLLNGLPSWQQYPLRNSSIVGSSCKGTASQYGPVWRVVLPNKGRVVLCPARDLWYSFDSTLVALGLGGADLDLRRFNEAITSVQKYLGLVPPDGYTGLVELLNNVASANPLPDNSLAITTTRFVKAVQEQEGRIEAWLDEMFAPTAHGFCLHSTVSFTRLFTHSNQEVWTDSECLLIEDRMFSEWSG